MLVEIQKETNELQHQYCKIDGLFENHWPADPRLLIDQWSFRSCATTIVSSSSVQQLYLSCPLYGVTTLTATLCPQLLMSDWSIMGGMFGCRAQWYYNYLIIVLLPLFAGVHSTISWAPTVVFTFAAGHNGHWTLFKIVLLCTHQHLTLPSPSPQTFNS